MLNAYFVLTFYYAISCTVQHHRILLYKYGAIEINKHLHLHYNLDMEIIQSNKDGINLSLVCYLYTNKCTAK